MPDQRESELASLIVELAGIEKNQVSAIKEMHATTRDIREQIQRLAAEIDSGQTELGL